MEYAKALVAGINRAIINPLLALLFAFALVVFLWGMINFLWRADTDEGKEEGRRHMIWGVLGMFIMVSAYAILKVVTATFGVSLPR